jgi:hypothetical protein
VTIFDPDRESPLKRAGMVLPRDPGVKRLGYGKGMPSSPTAILDLLVTARSLSIRYQTT